MTVIVITITLFELRIKHILGVKCGAVNASLVFGTCFCSSLVIRANALFGIIIVSRDIRHYQQITSSATIMTSKHDLHDPVWRKNLDQVSRVMVLRENR